MLRAGDHVLHRPSGEKWVLACDEDHGEIICCGWPETFAKASVCERIKAATDKERLSTLRDVARITDQRRGSLARVQLAAMEPAPTSEAVAYLADVAGPRSQYPDYADLWDRIAIALDAFRALPPASAVPVATPCPDAYGVLGGSRRSDRVGKFIWIADTATEATNAANELLGDRVVPLYGPEALAAARAEGMEEAAVKCQEIATDNYALARRASSVDAYRIEGEADGAARCAALIRAAAGRST